MVNEKENWGYLANGQRIRLPNVPYIKTNILTSHEEVEEAKRIERMNGYDNGTKIHGNLHSTKVK